jgi:hypothetical protein
MSVRTASNYIQSLRDGRLIYADGNEIKDIAINDLALQRQPSTARAHS